MQPHDAVGVSAMVVTLALVAAVATALPALRAVGVDPQRAHRDG